MFFLFDCFLFFTLDHCFSKKVQFGSILTLRWIEQSLSLTKYRVYQIHVNNHKLSGPKQSSVTGPSLSSELCG